MPLPSESSLAVVSAAIGMVVPSMSLVGNVRLEWGKFTDFNEKVVNQLAPIMSFNEDYVLIIDRDTSRSLHLLLDAEVSQHFVHGFTCLVDLQNAYCG